MSEHWRTHQIGNCISWVIRPSFVFVFISRTPFQTCLCVKMGLNVERNDKKTKHGFIISAATEISSPPNYGQFLLIRKWESGRICHGSQYFFLSKTGNEWVSLISKFLRISYCWLTLYQKLFTFYYFTIHDIKVQAKFNHVLFHINIITQI